MLNKVVEQKNSALYDEFVPATGFADTAAGELVRAVNRIGYRFWNDGDQIGIDYGNETCNAAARFILEQYPDTEMAKTVTSLWGLEHRDLYEDGVEMLVEQMINFIDDHPELKTEENIWDMLEFDELSDTEWEEEEDEEDIEDRYWTDHEDDWRE